MPVVTFASGTVIDRRYRIEREVGSGGSSHVYYATHIMLDRPVALKIGKTSDPVIVTSMENEARYIASFHHPNIVDVFDAGVLDDGRVFLACEWVDGEPLSQLFERARGAQQLLDYRDTLAVGLAMARALETVHASGILHRDIKPANVIVPLVAGRPAYAAAKVIDFGIAIKLDQMVASGELRTRSRTRAGTTLYSAPEQMTGRRQSIATDVFILGAVLFELFFGFPPQCDDYAVTRFNLPAPAGGPPIRVVVVPSRMESEVEVPTNFHVPGGIRVLLTCMLRRSPDSRPQTITPVRLALEDHLSTLGCESCSHDPRLASEHSPTIAAPAHWRNTGISSSQG